MIAKLIVWGADRRQALARMRQALAQYRVVGVANNVDFLARLVAVPSFANADLDTGLIEREQALLFPPAARCRPTCGCSPRWPSCCASSGSPRRRPRSAPIRDSPWRALDGWRLNGRAERSLTLAPRRRRAGGRRRGRCRAAIELTLGSQRVFARGTLGADSELQAQLGERRRARRGGRRRRAPPRLLRGPLVAAVAGRHAARRRRGRRGRRRPARADAGQGDRAARRARRRRWKRARRCWCWRR